MWRCLELMAIYYVDKLSRDIRFTTNLPFPLPSDVRLKGELISESCSITGDKNGYVRRRSRSVRLSSEQGWLKKSDLSKLLWPLPFNLQQHILLFSESYLIQTLS